MLADANAKCLAEFNFARQFPKGAWAILNLAIWAGPTARNQDSDVTSTQHQRSKDYCMLSCDVSALGGGLMPPQDRAAPPGSTRVAHMGLPLLRR